MINQDYSPQSIFYQYSMDSERFPSLYNYVQTFCKKYHVRPRGIFKKIDYEYRRQEKHRDYLEQKEREKEDLCLPQELRQEKVHYKPDFYTPNVSTRFEDNLPSFSDRNCKIQIMFKTPILNGHSITPKLSPLKRMSLMQSKIRIEEVNKAKALLIKSNLSFAEEIKLLTLKSFSRLIHKEFNLIHEQDTFTMSDLTSRFKEHNFEGKLSESITKLVLTKCLKGRFREYVTLIEELLSSKSKIIFSIFDAKGKGKIFLQDLFDWIKDSSFAFIIYDLLCIYNFIIKKETYLIENPKNKKNLGNVSPIYNYIKRKTLIHSSKIKDYKDDFLIITKKIDRRKFAEEGYITLNDMDKIDFQRNKYSDLFFVFIFFVYGEELCYKIMDNYQIPKFEFGFSKSEGYSYLHNVYNRIISRGDDRPFLISLARQAFVQISEEFIVKSINKFFQLVDVYCGLPSIITLQSFTANSKLIFNSEYQPFVKSLFDIIDVQKKSQISFIDFLDFHFELINSSKKKQEVSYSLYDIDKNGLITPSDIDAIESTINFDCRKDSLAKEFFLVKDSLLKKLMKGNVRFQIFLNEKDFIGIINPYSSLIEIICKFLQT